MNFYIVRQISGFLYTSMKLGRVIDHDHRSIFGYGATWDLTFGDL